MLIVSNRDIALRCGGHPRSTVASEHRVLTNMFPKLFPFLRAMIFGADEPCPTLLLSGFFGSWWVPLNYSVCEEVLPPTRNFLRQKKIARRIPL